MSVTVTRVGATGKRFTFTYEDPKAAWAMITLDPRFKVVGTPGSKGRRL